MEKNLKIKVSKKFSAYGKFSGSFNKPLCIIVHGLLGNMDEELYYTAAHWFKKHGFATFRFNLYGHQKDARQLMDCTLKIHGADIDAIVRYFRKKGVQKVFVVGHSFGGPTIFFSRDQNFNGTVLWDPSYKTSFTQSMPSFPGGTYIKELDGYLMKWGVNVIIGKAMAKETDTLPWKSIAKNFKVPFKIILAGKGVLKSAKNYISGAKTNTDLMIIKNATHYFSNQKKIREKIFKESEQWFRKYI